MITHIPTNTTVRCENERSQHQNKELAIKTLRARLWQNMQAKTFQDQSDIRNNQIGSGMRGDKRRTIQVQHNIVKDHLTGKHWRYEDYRNGKWSV
jgi:peptide chain release factor 1